MFKNHKLLDDLKLVRHQQQSSFQNQGKGSFPVRYEFRFTSIVAPGFHSVRTDMSSDVGVGVCRGHKRVLFKKSYLISSWFYYLSRRGPYKPLDVRSNKKLKLAILPSRRHMYTLTKAPMAHKTNSKEQFLFKYYNFKFSATLDLDHDFVPTTISQGAFTLNLLEKKFPSFGTNFLFLKYSRVKYPMRDTSFFSSMT